MNTRKKIWLAISVGVIVFFLWGIPIVVYEKSSFTYSMIGAVLLFISLFQYFGQFESLDDVFKKEDKNKPEVRGRYKAPFMIIPAIFFLFVAAVNFSHRKAGVLKYEGVLTKGIVLNGHATRSTSRSSTTTSYTLKVKFTDSLGVKHFFKGDVSAEDYNKIYEGAQVDVVYWRADPNVAKITFDIEELSKYKKIATTPISINNLTAIIEGAVNKDSIKVYLNTINYEWLDDTEPNTYENIKLSQFVRYNKEDSTIAFIEGYHQSGLVLNSEDANATFEKDLIQKGYKKKASSSDNGKVVELYYSDDYIVQKKNEVEHAVNGGVGMSSYTIYLIAKRNRK